MEISTSKNDLLKELTLTQGVVERKNTIPILSNLLFEVDESTLRISATDLDLGIRCSCPAKVKEGGSGTFPASDSLRLSVRCPMPKSSSNFSKTIGCRSTVR